MACVQSSHVQSVTTMPARNTQNAVYNPQYEKFEFLVRLDTLPRSRRPLFVPSLLLRMGAGMPPVCCV